MEGRGREGLTGDGKLSAQWNKQKKPTARKGDRGKLSEAQQAKEHIGKDGKWKCRRPCRRERGKMWGGAKNGLTYLETGYGVEVR